VHALSLLLSYILLYRRKEEEECIENLFGTLAATQLVPENQVRFRTGEGFELMIRCLREKKYAAQCAIKVCVCAVTYCSHC
jgi:hypothetical protein